jgi:hypothetical protein
MRDQHEHGCGCPGSRMQHFDAAPAPAATDQTGTRPSHLRQWPVQLHLVSPMAPYFQGADVLLSADCVAYAMGDFHQEYLQGKSLAIACPKLDDGQQTYVEKLTALIDEAKINTLTVMIMAVPCCQGLLNLARKAATAASRKVPIKCITVSLRGEVQSEDWV